jgi:YD repeat-containing protein
VQQPQTGAGPTVHIYDYDLAGNVIRETDELNHTTHNTYDALNRLLSTTDAAGVRVRYEYDEVGNRTKVFDGKDQLTRFEYDGLGRVTLEEDALWRRTLCMYDGLNETLRSTPLDQTSYGYDVRNRLKEVRYSVTPADNRDYSYDEAGNLLGVVEPGHCGTPSNPCQIADVSYTYDALNRVVSEKSSGRTHTYAYDLASNRTTVTYGGTGRTVTSVYDRLNRLKTMTEGGRSSAHVYDLAGISWKRLCPMETL